MSISFCQQVVDCGMYALKASITASAARMAPLPIAETGVVERAAIFREAVLEALRD